MAPAPKKAINTTGLQRIYSDVCDLQALYDLKEKNDDGTLVISSNDLQERRDDIHDDLKNHEQAEEYFINIGLVWNNESKEFGFLCIKIAMAKCLFFAFGHRKSSGGANNQTQWKQVVAFKLLMAGAPPELVDLVLAMPIPNQACQVLSSLSDWIDESREDLPNYPVCL